MQWLRDGLGVIETSSDVEPLAASVPDAGGVYFVPAFVGLGAPYWDAYARGAILGLTRGTTAAHIARAAVESMAYQSRDLLEAMQKDAGVELKELKVDGGASVNNALMQFQADRIGRRKVRRPVVSETTALGAAYLAGLAVGFWRDTADVTRNWALEQEFAPQLDATTRKRLVCRLEEGPCPLAGLARALGEQARTCLLACLFACSEKAHGTFGSGGMNACAVASLLSAE